METLGIKCHYVGNYSKKTHIYRLFWGDIATLTYGVIVKLNQ